MNTTQTAIKESESFVNDPEGHVPNEETIKVLKDSQAGRNVIGPFHNMNDFMTSLLSEETSA
jgi:hypothetical protein